MRLIGIDPGKKDGAAVQLERIALDAYTISGLVSWHHTGRRWRVRVWSPPVDETAHAATLVEAIRYVSDLQHDAVVSVEWPVYKARKGKRRSPASMVTLAYTAGLAMMAVPAPKATREVEVESWRESVLRIPGNTEGKRAKAYALRACAGKYASREPLPWSITNPDVLQSDHEAEAACVGLSAVYGGDEK